MSAIIIAAVIVLLCVLRVRHINRRMDSAWNRRQAEARHGRRDPRNGR